MDVAVLGGGPGGLYFAILHKLAFPHDAVRLYERNGADDVFGFGVAFHEATLRKLAEADTVSRDALEKLLVPWDDVAFHVRGNEFRVPGHAFAGVARKRLVEMLRQRAVDLDVEIMFHRNETVSDHPTADLVVVAEGASSRTRSLLAAELSPHSDPRPNRFAWFGTSKPMQEMNFYFRECPAGIFVAHAYPHADDQGTWIVETEHSTFCNAGLADADEPGAVDYLQDVFDDDLEGHSLQARDSVWRQFPAVSCERWIHDNVAFIGDAKATVHYSIGSGTKIAIEDALALVNSLRSANGNVARGLAGYEQARRPEVDLLQSRAFGSMLWFESMSAHWHLDPATFTFSGITRKTDESYASLAARAPQLASSTWQAFAGNGVARDGVPAVDVPLRIGETTLPGRQVKWDHTPAADGAAITLIPTTEASVHIPITRNAEIALLDLTHTHWPIDNSVAATAGFTELHATRTHNAIVGVRITCPPDPTALVGPLRSLLEAGCQLVSVRPGPRASARADVACDLVRQHLGVATICEGVVSLDEAETLLLAGRTDLITLE